LKKSQTMIVLWAIAATLTLVTACSRMPPPPERPVAATRVPAVVPRPAPPAKAVQPKTATVPPTFIHRVNGGETLSAIARWYTGKEDNWRRLAQVNPAIEPQRMRIGEQIHIPRDLLIRREPMPRTVQPVLRKKTPPASAGSGEKKQPPPPTTREIVAPRETPPVKDDVELFGPIENLPPAPKDATDTTDAPLELETLD